jgi:hypothetical protein
MQAYVDESGDKGQGSWLTLVGLVAHAEEWAVFADEWRSVLNQPPAIKAWHMRDAVNLQKGFRRWTPDERDDRLRQLSDVVNRHEITALHCSVDIPAYMEFMAPLIDVPFSSEKRKRSRALRAIHEQPYWICFHSMVMAVCYELIDKGVTERFEIIFDEKKTLGPRVRSWYPAMRIWMEPHEDAIMPVDPLFRDDEEFAPLQCADILAWILRRDLIDGDGAPVFLSPRKVERQSHSFDWVKNAMHGLVWSGHRQLFDRKRLQGIRELAIRDGISAERAAALDRLSPQ